MRLIDAEQYRKEFLDSRDFEPMKILDFQPTIKAIPLAKVEQAREEIKKKIGTPVCGEYIKQGYDWGLREALEILDKLIAESEN